MDSFTMGERLMIYRKRRKMTKKEVAAYLGVTPATISKYENDEVVPSIERLIDLSIVLNVSMMKIAVGFGSPARHEDRFGILGEEKWVAQALALGKTEEEARKGMRHIRI